MEVEVKNSNRDFMRNINTLVLGILTVLITWFGNTVMELKDSVKDLSSEIKVLQTKNDNLKEKNDDLKYKVEQWEKKLEDIRETAKRNRLQ
ncbi:hypothetical protein QNI22_07460 [Cytophagaceae bacterium BD1B2-1]|uniref:Uncharacterized protein n=2 Tax=Xanthocytophaga agilis TaxID=3048010 RepID=A0AAE3UCU2_9BACT|nr:hypothetical protein [Xanthocytophaga agilis]